jgi:hypothetical protein
MSAIEPLEQDYTLAEAVKALRCSDRWLRDKIKTDKLPHGRRGHKIVFSASQIEAIRQRYNAATPVEQSITTGRKRKSS